MKNRALNAETNAEAIARVRRALVLIEEAQNNLMQACQELSGIIPAAPRWRTVSKLYDRVKAEWYTLDL